MQILTRKYHEVAKTLVILNNRLEIPDNVPEPVIDSRHTIWLRLSQPKVILYNLFYCIEHILPPTDNIPLLKYCFGLDMAAGQLQNDKSVDA